MCNKWMDIETAPKNTRVDIWVNGCRLTDCWFTKFKHNDELDWYDSDDYRISNRGDSWVPTHWRLLPEPPEGK